MQIGMVGLGRMGANMTERLIGGGHEVVVYDRSTQAVQRAVTTGARGAASLEELVGALAGARRAVWVMVPAGAPTDQTITALGQLLHAGDVVIDGGNSKYTDSLRHAQALREVEIGFCDAGTSGGIWGLKEGYCLMVGGAVEDVSFVEPVFRTLAPPDGYLHTGPVGSGHFSKMVHNGIEYGLLQAYAEGFAILEKAPFTYDLGGLAKLWNHGSVVRSWLLELAELAFQDDPGLEHIRGYVDDSGEGRWTVEAAIAQAVAAPVITASLFARFASRDPDAFSAKVIAALRNQFGGHPVKTEPA
ncbi:decarboxylating 6-phosphogluconate dehydrogenase [bacterium]|nr:MAG: decarboxylating 6-phosphogluconate dehydrogenase [bacterium]